MDHLKAYISSQERGAMSNLARLLRVPAQTVRDWITGRRKIPDAHCAAIEFLSSGALCVEQLKPESPWLRYPDPGWPHPSGRPVLDIARPRISTTPTETEAAP